MYYSSIPQLANRRCFFIALSKAGGEIHLIVCSIPLFLLCKIFIMFIASPPVACIPSRVHHIQYMLIFSNDHINFSSKYSPRTHSPPPFKSYEILNLQKKTWQNPFFHFYKIIPISISDQIQSIKVFFKLTGTTPLSSQTHI